MIEQRKTVSVVFADLVESTSLAERHDPEVLADILRRYFSSLRATVEKHGGTVEKFIGDAVVGVFGVPTLHEDDALRAVRAALEMHDAISSLGASLQIRVGVNTGEVVVSADNALGHAISMAARLEQNADAGEVLIGRETFALVAGQVEASPVDDLSVKGSSQPISVWRVTGLRDVIPQGSRAGGVYVGRERELQQIASAYDSAIAQPSCVTVTVVGPPGLGKSRLLAEAASHVASNARVLTGLCQPYGQGITYAPLVEAVNQLQMVEGSDVVERLLVEQSDAQQVVARVRATLEGASTGSPDETAWAFRRAFEALAEDRPLVLIVDDIHWADALLLDLIEYVGTFSAGRPILILCGARPDLFDTRPGWSAPRENFLQLRLAPLTTTETAELVADVYGSELNDDARKQIVATSGGVPLFIEQMAAFNAEPEHGAQVPPTIRALLAARVDRLPPDERAVLEHAAIQGPTFRWDTLAELMPTQARAALGGQLMSLIRRDFIRVDQDAAGTDSFSFNHELIRDAVYEAMPRRSRASLHERYADILEVRQDTPDELVGHQLEQAYREHAALRESSAPINDLATRAGLALASAGRKAVAGKEANRAVDLLSRAAELLSVDPGVRLAVLPDLIDAFVGAGDIEAAGTIHAEAVTIARDIGDVTSELRAELAWAITEPRRAATGWQERILGVIERSIDHFGRLDDHANLARALLLKGVALSPRDQAAAIETLKQAQAHAQQTDDERIQVDAWDELGGAMIFGPTPFSETLEFTRREVDWAREHGIAFAVADGRLGEAYSLAALGEFDAALELLNELIDFFAQLPGDVSQHGECYTLAARVERDRGDSEAALRLYRKAMDVFAASGHGRWWRNAAPGVVHAALDLGRLDDAKQVLDEMTARDADTDGAPGAFRLDAEARYLARTGDIEAGIDFANRAVAEVADTGAPFYEGRARETLAALLVSSGNLGAARVQYELARSLYESKGYLPGIIRTVRAQRP